jgi:hypothetical protein
MQRSRREAPAAAGRRMMDVPWAELDPAAAGLPEERLVLHHAVQPAAAVGECLSARAADDSQQSLSLAGPRDWLGATVAGGTLRAGLDPQDLVLRLCDGAGRPLAALPLEGQTLDDALAFLRSELERRGQQAPGLALPRHPSDFPRHPLAAGARFPGGVPEARLQLVRLYASTQAVLGALAGAQPRMWPHHFDLACNLAAGAGSALAGVSPGDGQDGRPYWYATPSSRPAAGPHPALDGRGTWHTEGWFGAELPLERLGRGPGQEEQVASFFRSALAAAGAFARPAP